MMDKWDMHIKYARYIARHKWYVFRECHKAGLTWRGIVHDLSKLRPDEWGPYSRHFYGSGLESECPQAEFDAAWLRHQHRNPHHWQHWILREDDGGEYALEMPNNYCCEMVCDWRGAGRAITGKDNIREWYSANAGRIWLGRGTQQRVAEMVFGTSRGDE